MDFGLSVLDVSPVSSGSNGAQALHNTLELARLTDRLGYERYWLAEHHNLPSIASSAPEIMIGHVASETSRIRVGAGGIMLPNHAPLKVAETFRVLEAVHPQRIDLGIGRAPGTDPVTATALRRSRDGVEAEDFPQRFGELLAFSGDGFPEEARAYPYTPAERRLADAYRSMQVVGKPRTVRAGIEELARHTAADEVMITTNVYDHGERLRSYERLAEVFDIATPGK
jgi:alkanesulfonate monooxygenase SsuD/methylene tetrahydromethanopterin reductase-like flavin-dependent oxidoreductase (luciferase family)